MLKLIKNEYAKIFHKKTTYIVLILCILLGLGISALIQLDNSYMYDYDYDSSIEEEKSWYINSDYIYDKLNLYSLNLYENMGYKYRSEIPGWVEMAVDSYTSSHYAYILISESKNIAESEVDMDMRLSDTDIEYEKEISQRMEKSILGLDYSAYFDLCVEYYEHQTAKNLVCDKSNYELAKSIKKYNINPEKNETLLSSLHSYVSAKMAYDELIEEKNRGVHIPEEQFQKTAKTYLTYKYIFDNHIENYMMINEDYGGAYSQNKFIMALSSDTVMAGLAGIFIIIIAAGIFANEYSNGTIKFLLINPVKRAKIFWSKYLSCITLFAGALVIFYIIYFLFAMIICGTDGIDGVFLSYADGVVSEQHIILYSLKQYGLTAVSLITSITLAFTISAFIRSTALAIAISLVIEFAGSTISMFLYQLGHDWGRYLIFSNTDLASFSNGMGMFPGQTLTFALVTIAVYMVVFMLTAYDGFTRKEI